MSIFILSPIYSQNQNKIEDKLLLLEKYAENNANKGNYAEAIRLGTKALEIREKVWGKENPNFAQSLHNLAKYTFFMGNYAEAIRLGTEVLEIRERVLGKEHPDYASSLNNLANYYSYLGNNAEAIRLGTEGLEIYEKVSDKEHPEYATLLNNFALFNSYLGNYEEAIRLGTEAMKIFENVYGKEHPNYAQALGNLANYNSNLGNYAEAIRLGTETMEILGKVLGKEHLDYATSLGNLASYNSAIGNYEEAIRLGTEALEIREKILGNEHPDYAISLGNLANYNSYLGNYTEAIRLGTEAMKIFENVYGKEHPNYAQALDNLASYNSYLGNYAEAIRLETIALEIREKTLGTEHPDYAISLNNLANNYSYLGNYAEAINFGTEALKIWGKALGKEHPNYAISLKSLASCSFDNGDYDVASNYIIASSQLCSKLILGTFSDLTSVERTLFWNKYKNWFETSLPKYTFYIQNDSLIALEYDGTLLSKGLLLNTELEMNKLLQESGDSTILSKYEELRSNRMMLNKLYEKPIAERFLNTDSLERAIQSQERELVQASKIYGNYTKNLSINWRQVQDKLGKNDVAVEFLNFGVENDSVMYVALTLTKDDNVPHIIHLFEKKELDEIDSDDYYTSPKLSELVWQPLESVLSNKENIYFAPAGELHNIAIESIPLYNGDGLVSDKWKMYRLSSTRSLALIKDENDIKNADIYGGLTYGADSQTLINNSMKYGGSRSIDFASLSIADSLNLRAGVTDLPGTMLEAKDVDKTLAKMNVNTKLYTDTIGTEASFKALSGQKPNLIHIATHGFYWDESEAKEMSNLAFLAMSNDDSRQRYVEDKALTRSGLFFTGANNALQGKTLPDGVDDGVLTAREISLLDLRGLDLVVLSACETGLGEITGDGVFGLQRGFKKAGANAIMMSLWKVDDDATQILMGEFYQNLLSGNSKREAFLRAQDYLRSTENGKYSKPEFWTAFILLDAIE